MTEDKSFRLAVWGVRVAGTTGVVIGVFWLAAWLSGAAAQWSAAGVVTVKANMALAQILAGTALLLLRTGKEVAGRRGAGLVAACAVLMIGG